MTFDIGLVTKESWLNSGLIGLVNLIMIIIIPQ